MPKKLLMKYTVLPIQVKASFWFLICSFLQKGISVITTPIFTRILTTAEYGQYNVFTSWQSIITVFVTLNLFSGVYTQGLVKYESEEDQYTSSLLGLCTTLVIMWTIIYMSFHDFWNKLFSLTTIQMISMLIIMWTSSIFNFWSVKERVHFKYKNLVLLTVFISLAKPAMGILLVVYAEHKVTARILGIVIIELIAFTGLYVTQMKRGKKFYSNKVWRYVLCFNLPLVPHYLSQSVLNSADRIMIGRMIDENAAGIYSLAYSVALIMTLFNTALLQTIEPWMYKKIKAGQISELAKVAYPTFSIVAVVNVILIAFAPEVIGIFAPSEYHNAIWIIPPVAMSVFFMFAYTFFAVFEFYFEKTQYIAFATVMGALLNILLNYIFINIFGYYAAGYTTLICYIIYAVFHYYFMRKLVRENFNEKTVYNTKILFCISFVFVIIGFLFLSTYENYLFRHILIAALLCILVINYKNVLEQVKKLLNIRK